MASLNLFYWFHRCTRSYDWLHDIFVTIHGYYKSVYVNNFLFVQIDSEIRLQNVLL